MDSNFLFIQFIGILGAVLYFLSFQYKENRKLYLMQFLAYIGYITHFFLLGAITGGISYILNLARSLFLASEWKFARSNKMCIVLCCLQIVVAVITWDGWISLLPVGANIATTIGGYTHNAQKIRIANMFINSPLWIIYDLIIGSWAGVLDEIASEISIFISIRKYGWKNLNEIND